MSIFSTVHDFHNVIPVPVEIVKEDPRLTEVRTALKLLKRNTNNAKSIYITAIAKDIDPLLWCMSVEQESEFKITAKSPNGKYKGLGQGPRAIMKLGYEEADLMATACIFAEKRKIAKGDEQLAWALYKGGNNPAAKNVRNALFKNYYRMKEKING
jgi:hypothetical protein